jgi:hypothetical protein
MKANNIRSWISRYLEWIQNRPGPAILWLPVIIPVLLFLLILSKVLLIISPIEEDNL